MSTYYLIRHFQAACTLGQACTGGVEGGELLRKPNDRAMTANATFFPCGSMNPCKTTLFSRCRNWKKQAEAEYQRQTKCQISNNYNQRRICPTNTQYSFPK